MQQLKRVGWHIGQPLLPNHLIAQEDSLLAHANFFLHAQGIPYSGVGSLKWDDTLLSQGVVSITHCCLVFPSGEVVDVPENGKISSFDMNTLGQNHVTLYCHLLKETTEEDVYGEGLEEEEKITYSIYQLVLSPESHLFSAKVSMKLAEFERDVESRWKLSENFVPPLFSTNGHPFLTAKLSRIRTIIEGFQKELELESATGKYFEQRTLETKLCLVEVTKLRQFLLNLDKGVITHPYYLYEQLTYFLTSLTFMYVDYGEYSVIPYQHDKLALLFKKIVEHLIKCLKPKSERLASLPFEKKENCYVSERLPQDIYDAKEIFFIVQQVDSKVKQPIQGLKLASYSRLFNVHRFALTGIVLLRLESAPFNNNFSKYAQVYRVEKDTEWDHALAEGKVAFSEQKDGSDLQAFFYWR